MLGPDLVPDGLGSGLAPSRGEEARGDLRQVVGSAHSVVGVEDQWRRAVAGAQGSPPRRDWWSNVSLPGDCGQTPSRLSLWAASCVRGQSAGPDELKEDQEKFTLATRRMGRIINRKI